MKKFFISLIMVLSVAALRSQDADLKNIVQDQISGSGDFCLVCDEQVADIVVDIKDNKTVRLASELFCDDLERVSGFRPEAKGDFKNVSGNCVIIGSIDESRIIKRLIRENKIDIKEIKNQWEACLIQVVDNPMNGIDRALVIAGSDRRGTAYGLFEISSQMGVSPWYYFADVHPQKRDKVVIKKGRYIQGPPSVKYRGIFINDEMWGIRPWAMKTLAPEEGKGLGPTTYSKVFELLLRLKANFLWPAMHQQTRPFNYYEENKVIADNFGIIMGSSHIEPMLRNNIAGAEWDNEYPGEPWDYTINRDHIYKYWEERVKQNGKYENIYTIGKRGKDDEAGSDITVPVLEQIFEDQRTILKKYVNKNISEVPQVLIPYTEVLDLYNKGLKVPDDVIICWPDDNFGYIRQLPDQEEQKRSGGSGIYYHFQWLNGATTAYPWLYTTPLGLVWTEMKKAYDYNVRKLWVVNVGDIKPAEIGIDYFMRMAWDISDFKEDNSNEFILKWASRNFGKQYVSGIADIMSKHFELGYARRPEHMVMFDGRKRDIEWKWFSLSNYNDEADRRVIEYNALINKTDSIYNLLPPDLKDAFFEMILYNVKCAGLQNKKVIYAQKSKIYGEQHRASAAKYAALAQEAEDEIYGIINHYNNDLLTVGNKWDYMASLPGPWGGQWHQWDMPPLSSYSGEGEPELHHNIEGDSETVLPGFSKFTDEKRFIDIYNSGNGVICWSAKVSDDWIKLNESSGVLYDEKRIWISIDWDKAPESTSAEGNILFTWYSSISDEWRSFEQMSAVKRKAYVEGTLDSIEADSLDMVDIRISKPEISIRDNDPYFVESNGYISIEAEHFSRRKEGKGASWKVIEGLGRTGNSVTVLPATVKPQYDIEGILEYSPLLEYDVLFFSTDTAEIIINCIPTKPPTPDYGSSIAVAIDDKIPVIVSSGRGKSSVIENLMTISKKLKINNQGMHVLKIWMTDPGIVIDKIIINAGGLEPSYLGPPETIIKGPK